MGVKREGSNKVVIGVRPGKFSSSIRLLSLHESFQSYFAQSVRQRAPSIEVMKRNPGLSNN